MPIKFMANTQGSIIRYQIALPGNLKDITLDPMQGVSSQYANGKPAQIARSVYDALSVYSSIDLGGWGETENGQIVAETYDTEKNKGTAAIYNPTSGQIMAVVYDYDAQLYSQYEVSDSLNGAVILLALLPELLKDKEAMAQYTLIKDIIGKKPEHIDDAEKETLKVSLAILSDNFRIRLREMKNVKIPGSGYYPLIAEFSIQQGIYTPTDASIHGRFGIFTNKRAAVKVKTGKLSEIKDNFLIGKQEDLTEEGKRLFLDLKGQLNSDMVVSEEGMVILSLIKNITFFRNGILSGPPGTGKTTLCQMLAYALGIPYVHMECNPKFDKFDLVGSLQPRTTKGQKRISLKQFMEQNELPTAEDVEFDLEGSYKKLHEGEELPSGYDKTELYEELISKVYQMAASEDGDYTFVYSPFTKAIKNGWFCEIEEIGSVKDQAFLNAVNHCMAMGDMILPNGETIQRHKNAVIFFTTNKDYKEYNALLSNVTSRLHIVKEIPEPSEEVILQRVMMNAGISEVYREDTRKIVSIIKKIEEYQDARKRGPVGKRDNKDCAGIREAVNWSAAHAAFGGKDILTAYMYTVYEKVSQNKDEQQDIFNNIVKQELGISAI